MGASRSCVRERAWLAAALACACVATQAQRARAQQAPAPSESSAAAASTAWQPVVFEYRGNGIDLLEAVRLTLGQDPNLLLRGEDVRTAEGFALELAGAFDWTLTGQGTYEHRIQELRDSQRQGEVDRRNQIRDVQALACTEEENLRGELADLLRVQAGETGVDIRNDPGFEAQLRIIEAAIIAAEGNPDQQEQLRQTAANLLQTEIAVTQEAIDAADQACREAGQALDNMGEVPDEEDFDIVRLQLRGEKLLRSGFRLAPFLQASFDSTQFVGKRNGFIVPAVDPYGTPLFSPSGIPLTRLVSFGGKDIDDVYTVDVGFEVNAPLLRNRGVEATGAQERAAQIDLDASRQLLEHAASESVLNTAFAYWNLVAAQERVRVLESSVGLQRRVVDITGSLVEAAELPGAEMPRARAGEANALAQLESAQRDLATARLDLVRAMGLSVDDAGDVPSAAESFPPPPSREAVAALEAELVRLGVASRRDLVAARTLVESGDVLAQAAILALRPQLDATVAAWLTARGDESLGDAFDHVADEPSWRVQANYEQPFGNRTARGRVLQQESLVRQRQISQADLERQIRIGVVQTAASLVEAIDELARAEQAAEAFERTVQSELEKLGLGETTLLDAILTEQQRTSSLVSAIVARFRIATLLAQLRFESGTLVEQTESGPRVSEESLKTLPGAG